MRAKFQEADWVWTLGTQWPPLSIAKSKVNHCSPKAIYKLMPKLEPEP